MTKSTSFASFRVRQAVALGLILTVLSGALHAAEGQQLARKILDETGIKGGLVVHLGCGDGKLTASLRANESYLVQGLDTSAGNVEEARGHIQAIGLYGAISVNALQAGTLPYVDNVVNLLVSEDLGEVSMDEIMRVLAPGGAAYLKQQDQWSKRVKPRPAEIDQWTHFLHDATGNAVAHDALVGPPEHLQWMAGPAHTRHHEHTTSITTVVSSAGRLFYVQDEGPNVSILMPPKWFLVARDAFNGTLLWKRPIEPWLPPLIGFRSNPGWLQRTLIAVGDRVYVTLGLGRAVTALDAATGETLNTYAATKGAEEIVHSDGRLFVVTAPAGAGLRASVAEIAIGQPAAKRIVALDATTGDVLWEKSDEDTTEVLPLTLAVGSGRVFVQNGDAVLCLDRETGETRWRHARPATRRRNLRTPPTLVVYGAVVLCADSAVTPPGFPNGELVALSVETGRRLWSTPCGEGYVAPPDVFVADGLVWVGTNRRLGNVYREPEFTEGLDPLTGEVRRRLDTSLAFLDRPHHHRCYRNKATDRFLVTGRHGVEMIPLDGDRPLLNDWVRGACRYGVLPCNGLLYLPPHACSCHISQMLGHFRALAAGSKAESGKRKAEQEQVVRLQKGPAYGRNIHHSSFSIHHSADWPTYRHDAARSGSTRTAVPTVLEQAWETDLPGKPTGLTAADGKVFVAVPDAHAVYALDAVAGGVLWRFTAGGRVDSPPTVARELALFGSADGSVYCLRASSGELVWRFQAAPRDFRTVVDNRVESVWPVHGSVLVHDGSVYATAGRSSNLDGGIRVYQLEVGTGRTLSQTVLKARGGTVQGRQQGPSDLLTADDHYVYLRFQPFPLADLNATASQTAARGEKADESSRLICPTGFLDDTWWHRSFWAFGKSKVFGDPRTVGTRAPAGQIMVFDDQAVYGYGRKPEYFMWTTPVEFRLFAADRQAMILPLELKQKQPQQSWLKHPERQFATRWSREVPLHVRAMVLADQTLFIAGPPSIAKEGPPETSASTSRLSPAQAGQSLDAWEGKSGARLWAVSTEDGSRLTEYALDCLPTWDGMAAAGGRLYLSTTDGTVVCLAANE